MARKKKKKVEATPESLMGLLTEVWAEGCDIRGKSIGSRNRLKKLMDEIIDNPSDDMDGDINKLSYVMKAMKDQEVNERDAVRTKMEVAKVLQNYILAAKKAEADAAAANGGVEASTGGLGISKAQLHDLMKQAQNAKKSSGSKKSK